MTSGFGFGSKTTTTASPFGTGGITFGTPTAQTQPTFNFGGTSMTPQQGFQLGGAPATTASTGLGLFGSQIGQTTGFGAPAATTGFGASAATSGFGAPAAATGFGAPAATTGFGAPAATTGFGAPAATTGFGAPAATTGFGASAATTGFGSSAATTTAMQPAATGLFGAPAAAAPATSTTSGLSFGLPSATPAFSFGPPASTSTTLTFGTSSANNASTGLFSSLSTAAPSLTFGTSTSQSLSLGGPTTSTGLNFGFGGPATSQTLTLPTTTTTIPSTTTVPSSSVMGLGGVATTQAKTTAAQKEVPPKEQPLPNEILQGVEQFIQFVKQQKTYSSDIARCSVKEYRKVEGEIDELTKTMDQVESQLNKNRHLAEQLKYNTAKCFRDAEMAQRTQDTPPGLQYENTAPQQFFLELADHFEKEMQTLKAQIESVDKQIKDYKGSNAITPQELNVGLKRLHETFVALAGRLYSVHNQVEVQKEVYLKWRKEKFNDNSNPFEELDNAYEEIRRSAPAPFSPPNVVTGPTPFSNLVLTSGGVLQPSQANSGEQNTGVGYTGFGAAGGPQSTSLFGATTQTPFNASTNFQLQKPPTGNKRGKQ